MEVGGVGLFAVYVSSTTASLSADREPVPEARAVWPAVAGKLVIAVAVTRPFTPRPAFIVLYVYQLSPSLLEQRERLDPRHGHRHHAAIKPSQFDTQWTPAAAAALRLDATPAHHACSSPTPRTIPSLTPDSWKPLAGPSKPLPLNSSPPTSPLANPTNMDQTLTDPLCPQCIDHFGGR